MKFSIQRNEIYEALQKVVSVLPARSTIPMTQNVLFVAEGDQLELMATDLEITIIGSEDKLSIVDWYANSAGKADAFVTAEGSVLAWHNVEQLVSAMARFAPPAMGETQLPEEMRSELEQALAVGWQ